MCKERVDAAGLRSGRAMSLLKEGRPVANA
jgi:hypothetical protein